MAVLDPRLQYLRAQPLERLRGLESLGRFAVAVTKDAQVMVRVLLRFEGSLGAVEAVGFRRTAVAGDVAAGSIPQDRLGDLEAIATVTLVESSRPLAADLDVSVPETRADQVRSGVPPYTGAGVILGIIDTGIDYRHGCFRKASGATRILSLWDQSLSPQGNETHPAGYDYGVEYTQADIDAALQPGSPENLRHGDAHGHGTHVAGIAVGNGLASGNGEPAGRMIGMAPEADLIVVANTQGADHLGDSANTLDAVQYLFNKAKELGRPIVVNLSQGDNIGPHDGTSLLERGIDNLLGEPGQAIVKSAGNAGADSIHAVADVPANGVLEIPFRVPGNDLTPETIDLWYSGPARLSLEVIDPSGNASTAVAPRGTTDPPLVLKNHNELFVSAQLADPFNGDHRIYVQLSRGSASAIRKGSWKLRLSETAGAASRVHGWIERGSVIARFLAPQVTREGTITIPGTSKKIIAVGAYSTKNAPDLGRLASFSSAGPTRDLRPKPEIAAPGRVVFSARAGGTPTVYVGDQGTSMAAPHVAGTIALMFEKNKNLDQQGITGILQQTARQDQKTGNPPANGWGAGKLNAAAAVQAS